MMFSQDLNRLFLSGELCEMKIPFPFNLLASLFSASHIQNFSSPPPPSLSLSLSLSVYIYIYIYIYIYCTRFIRVPLTGFFPFPIRRYILGDFYPFCLNLSKRKYPSIHYLKVKIFRLFIPENILQGDKSRLLLFLNTSKLF